ncbi:hypothetical protein BT93_A1425 [Corymbia citriodora subsp. variegata]|nr:hypothetical protein BT93_A1425 [Corymbia citriodora subsp. variegata]
MRMHYQKKCRLIVLTKKLLNSLMCACSYCQAWIQFMSKKSLFQCLTQETKVRIQLKFSWCKNISYREILMNRNRDTENLSGGSGLRSCPFLGYLPMLCSKCS